MYALSFTSATEQNPVSGAPPPTEDTAKIYLIAHAYYLFKKAESSLGASGFEVDADTRTACKERFVHFNQNCLLHMLLNDMRCVVSKFREINYPYIHKVYQALLKKLMDDTGNGCKAPVAASQPAANARRRSLLGWTFSDPPPPPPLAPVSTSITSRSLLLYWIAVNDSAIGLLAGSIHHVSRELQIACSALGSRETLFFREGSDADTTTTTTAAPSHLGCDLLCDNTGLVKPKIDAYFQIHFCTPITDSSMSDMDKRKEYDTKCAYFLKKDSKMIGRLRYEIKGVGP